jgi:hypothetical protein
MLWRKYQIQFMGLSRVKALLNLTLTGSSVFESVETEWEELFLRSLSDIFLRLELLCILIRLLQ